MDKRTIIGIALIIVITLMMPFYQRWISGDQEPRNGREKDSLLTITDTVARPEQLPETPQPAAEPLLVPDELPPALVAGAEEVKTIIIENEVTRFAWTTARGGSPELWELKNYKYHLGGNVNLVDENGLRIHFLNRDGKEFNLNEYTLFADFTDGKTIQLSPDNPRFDLIFYLPVGNGRLQKTLRFYYDKYSFDVIVDFFNLQDYVINRRYFIGWQNGLPPTEALIGDDEGYARAYTYMAEELVNIDASDKYGEEDFNGRVDWAAIRTKYFLVSLIPANPNLTSGVTIGGIKVKENGTERKHYDFAVEAQFQPQALHSDTFTVFWGPLDYYVVKKYDVDLQTLVMNRDWYERLFRPISLMIIPAFKFLFRFIPNYGLVIIVFSVLIKILLHPLTKKSYQSMSEMQFLQPKMTELREKYKDDPQRMNKELMSLYKERGINPLGGCLPMLLQMPVLFALFIVFRSTIQLRGQPFMLWINDLSAPDILHIGISLPFIGDSIHVLPILMGVTMVWQSRMSITDPKQKLMMYFMPVFMIFIFYSLPSGLNLYYAVFNVISMAQTSYIKKKTHPKSDEEEKSPAPVVRKPAVRRGKRKK